MNLALPVESVSDTAYLMAFCRALETERADAHFRDPYARGLAGLRGEELLDRFPGGVDNAVGCIVRTCLFDELIQQTIVEDGIDTVLNLGAGLDTRPYRLSLGPSLRWIEVDHPAVLAYKSSKLDGAKAGCELQRLALDITHLESRRAFFEQIGGSARRVLLVTEGLLIYLPPQQVAALACDLHEHPQFQWWLCDLSSPITLQLAREHLTAAPAADSPQLHFAPVEGAGFFKPYGWEAAECRWSSDEARQLQRPFVPDDVFARLSSEQRDLLRQLTAVVKLQRVRRAPQENKCPRPANSHPIT